MAQGIGAEDVKCYCDSQLVVNQVNGGYNTKNERMEAYLKIVKDLTKDLNFTMIKIARTENITAVTLAALALTLEPILRHIIPVESIDKPSIELPKKDVEMVASIPDNDIGSDTKIIETPDLTENSVDWREEILSYIIDCKTPEDKWTTRHSKQNTLIILSSMASYIEELLMEYC